MSRAEAAGDARPARGPARWIPALGWLRRYRGAWLRGDLVAALTTWALVVPQAIAYAQIAGLPAEAGLSTTFAGVVGYALLGTSRQLVVSPTSSTAAVSAALVAPLALGDASKHAALSAALAILTGVVLAILGLLRMGFVSRFIAAAVQAGFMFGLGMTIIVGQLPKLLGIPPGEGAFFPQLRSVVSGLERTNAWTAGIGIGSLVVLLVLRRIAPVVPAALVVVVAGIVLVAALGLEARGVAVLGAAGGALPLPALPRTGWSDTVALLPGALAISVIGYAESATVAERFAQAHRYDIRPDQELVALGGANVLSGLFGGFITGGGASQSAANDRAGARTQLASLLVAALVLLTAVALLPLFRGLPQAVLGAIVIAAVIGFLDVAPLRRIARLRRDSTAAALLAMAGVLVLGVLPGLLLAVAASIVLLLTRVARPQLSVLGRAADGAVVSFDRDPAARAIPGVLMCRLDAPMLFINAKRLRDRVRERVRSADPPVRIVVVDLSFSHDLDVEDVDVLAAMQRELGEASVELWLAGVRVKSRGMLQRSGLAGALGEGRVVDRVDEAATAAEGAAAGAVRADVQGRSGG